MGKKKPGTGVGGRHAITTNPRKQPSPLTRDEAEAVRICREAGVYLVVDRGKKTRPWMLWDLGTGRYYLTYFPTRSWWTNGRDSGPARGLIAALAVIPTL